MPRRQPGYIRKFNALTTKDSNDQPDITEEVTPMLVPEENLPDNTVQDNQEETQISEPVENIPMPALAPEVSEEVDETAVLRNYIEQLERKLQEKETAEEKRKQDQLETYKLTVIRRTPTRFSPEVAIQRGFGLSHADFERLEMEHYQTGTPCAGCGDPAHGLRECVWFGTASERIEFARQYEWCLNCATHSTAHNNQCNSDQKFCGYCLRAGSPEYNHNIIYCTQFFTDERVFYEKCIRLERQNIRRTNFRGGKFTLKRRKE